MNLIKSTGTFSFFTFISRISGYFRDILIAIYLGAGPVADAFFVAFRIPNTFRRLFSEGTFNAAFVPSYSSELIRGKKDANTFANSIFNLLLLGLFFTFTSFFVGDSIIGNLARIWISVLLAYFLPYIDISSQHWAEAIKKVIIFHALFLIFDFLFETPWGWDYQGYFFIGFRNI